MMLHRSEPMKVRVERVTFDRGSPQTAMKATCRSNTFTPGLLPRPQPYVWRHRLATAGTLSLNAGQSY